MAEKREGILLKGIGGFYSVEAADAVYTCRARGIFRRQGITPLAGDRVRISLLDDGSGALEEILPRRNSLIRPPVANVDVLVVVASITDPIPSTRLLDSMIVAAESRQMDPLLVINKADLEDPSWLADIYRLAGIEVFVLSSFDVEGVRPLRQRLGRTGTGSGQIAVLTGNSGVGKSSLLNAMAPELLVEMGETSKKLGRGRHTTRSASLYKLPEGGYLVDTPGFSALDSEKTDLPDAEELPGFFREFAPFLGRCRFTSCAHVKEPGCAIRQAVDDGKIALSRYESYVSLYQEARERRPEWDRPASKRKSD